MPRLATLTAAVRLLLLALLSATATTALVPVASASWRSLATSPAPNPDDAVALMAAVPAAAGTAWIAVTAALTLLTLDWRRPGYRRTRFAVTVHAVTPRLVHRFAAAALSAGVVMGPAQAALAAGPYDPSWVTSTAATVSAPPRPGATAAAAAATDLAATAPAATTPAAAASAADASDTSGAATSASSPAEPQDGPVVVRAGDSLWSIAAAHLPPGATSDAVAAAWPGWYRANRAVIGADPDLIVPGQQLSPPR